MSELKHGFKLKSEQMIEELKSKVYEYEHAATGARLLYIAADDDNKVFSIGFRTPPHDDTGVAHIIEHSVLCGSKKYPLKEPFVELVKGSLNTFLNAMTYPDKTVYPIASRNDKDFKNLMDVYLDAVFNPRIYTMPEILKQEGWHYEIENPDEPLKYSGVVYNEMKGALSSPDDILGSKVMQAMFPDTCYGYESGGDPEAIPNLTQEMFLDFHGKYYHPSNSYIYLYGDVDIDERLEYLDREYLSKYNKIEVPSKIERQSHFSAMKRVEEFYPIGDEESAENKTFLSLSFLAGDTLDSTKMLGLEILTHALLISPAAPLRKALIDAGLGKDVDSSFDEELLQPVLGIVVNGSEADRADKFYELTMSKLKELAKDGIDKTLLQASINIREFNLREADFGGTPKGLVYGLRSLRSTLYDGDPTIYLKYEDALKEIKAGLDNGYFEKLIEDCLINNTHCVLLTLRPSRTIAKERKEKQAKLLEQVKAQMTNSEIAGVIEAAKKLKEHQEAPETPEALETIPILKLSDIRNAAEQLPLKFRDLDGTRIMHSNVETNGIVYLNLYFDASKVPQDKLLHAYLLTELLGVVDTKQRSYEELANLVNLNLGGFGAALSAYTKSGKADSFIPKLKVSTKALASKLPELSDILTEILTESTFINKKRIRELIEEEQIGIELNLQRAANQLVSLKIASYLSTAGAYNNESFLPFNTFLKGLLANYDNWYDELVDDLYDVMNQLVNRNGLIVGITANDELYAEFKPHLSRFLKSLPVDEYNEAHYHYVLKAQNEGLCSQSRVQYVGKGANFINLGYKYSGAMRVLETILRYEYFWTEIRVKGGAYGAFVNFNRNGQMYFGSYRDPNLKGTLDVFDHTADFLKNFKVSEREMDKYIIGTISRMDTPLTPSMKGNIAADLCIRNITFEDRQKTRDEVLAARQSDIQALSEIINACMKENNLCVYGNEDKIKANSELFGKIENVN